LASRPFGMRNELTMKPKISATVLTRSSCVYTPRKMPIKRLTRKALTF
jgi:hypothetical protein